MFSINDYVKFHNGKRTVNGTVTKVEGDDVTIFECPGSCYKVNRYNVSDVKPELHNTKLVYESDDVMIGREERTGRTYIYELDNDGETWNPGRYVEFDRSRNEWVSEHTRPNVFFTTHDEIATYWRQNMMLTKGPAKGSQEWIDSMMNNLLPEGQSLTHAGLYTMEDLVIANKLVRSGKTIRR